MGFSRAVYKEAFSIKRDRRDRATAQFEKLKAELYSANPRLTEIETKQRALGSAAAIAAMSGDTQSVDKMRAEIDALKSEKEKLLGGIDFPSVQYECPKCRDTGYASDGKICDCVNEIAKELSYKALCEEMPMCDSQFEGFDLKYYGDEKIGNITPKKRMTQVLKICREYALNFDKDGGNLLLLGGAGLGKTHLSLAIANEVLKNSHSVIYMSVQNLINKLSAETFSYSGSTEVSDSVLDCDLLIIDDLGSEMSTSFSQASIYNIINTRIMRSKPTVISTNLTLDEIERQYTARVSSRIIGNYTMLQFLGTDIRQQKAINAIKNK